MKSALRSLAFFVLFFGLAFPALAADPAKWEDAKTVELKGLQVAISKPVLVARSSKYLWFPSVTELSNGDLLAMMSNYADLHVQTSTCMASWSRDGGLTWTKPVQHQYGEANVRLPNGDQLFLPYYMKPLKDGGMGGPYQLNPKGKQELELKQGLTVHGLPKPAKSFAPDLGLAGFVFNGGTEVTRDGTFLATLYGTFEGDKRYSLICVESKDGVAWKFRSLVAGADCPVAGAEGPCEAATVRLADGRLMCVFRLASSVPLGQAFSEDEGKTWSTAVAMAGPNSVQPGLVRMKDGTLALSSGRPGIAVWLDMKGDGAAWQKVDLHAHHNALFPNEQIGPLERTSSYTEILALDEKHLLVIYDRIPSGWHAIPADSKDTNSVWVVRLAISR